VDKLGITTPIFIVACVVVSYPQVKKYYVFLVKYVTIKEVETSEKKGCRLSPSKKTLLKKMNKTKIAVVTGGTLALVSPLFAFADTLSTSTAQTIVVNATGDLGSVLATIIPVILGIVVALLALGMGIRYVKKHVSGRKF